MFVTGLAEDIANTISQMKEGETSSIARMVHRVLNGEYDGDMFLLMDLVLFESAKRGVFLDYSDHNGKEEGLPFNLSFVKRSSDAVGDLPGDVRICVLHHPLRGCSSWPGMKVNEYEVDRAIVVFDGLIKRAKEMYWRCDGGRGFTLDFQLVDENYCAIVLIDGAYKRPFEVLIRAYGEAISYEVGLVDAMEEWTFIVYRGALDIGRAMDGYRKVSDGEYVSIDDEKERDEYFARLSGLS